LGCWGALHFGGLQALAVGHKQYRSEGIGLQVEIIALKQCAASAAQGYL
jgi:hypothetical protein